MRLAFKAIRDLRNGPAFASNSIIDEAANNAVKPVALCLRVRFEQGKAQSVREDFIAWPSTCISVPLSA
jgi:hypothetical protein